MKRSSWVVLVLALSVLAVSAWFVFGPKQKLPEDPLAVVPADAYGVVRMRMDRVLASDAFKRLVVERGEASGMQNVKKECGYNPLERLTDVVIFARPAPDGGLPRVAFAARGELRHDELIDCVQKVTGVDRSKLQTETIEGITTVKSSKGTSRAAFVGRDGIIGGDAETVRHTINVMLGKAPSIAKDPLLSGLFREVQQGQDIAAVARIPESFRPELKKLSTEALGGLLRPLAEVQAFSANVDLSAGKVSGGAMLLASGGNEAQNIVTLAKSQIDRVLRIPGVVLTPAGGLLRGIQMEARGDRVTFAGSVKVSTLAALLELLPALEQLRGVLADPSAQAAQGIAADANQTADSNSSAP